MSKSTKISIITVSFNSAKTIKDTIESIISQNYNNIEYLIIDGGSLDGTIDIAKKYSKHIEYIVSGSDNGIYDAMNKGIKAATGDIIGILNSDDFYPNSEIISNVAKVFSKSECDCLYGDLVYVNKRDRQKIVRYWKSGDFSISKLENGWTLPHPTFFVRKSVYDEYGLYNTDFKTASDYDMILRLLYKNKLKVAYFPEVMVNMRIGGESNRSFWNRLRANQEDGLAWTYNKLNKPMFIRLKKPLQKLKQFFLKP